MEPPTQNLLKTLDTKTLNLSRNIVSLQVFVDVFRFSPCVINLSRNKNICCGLKKVVAKSRAHVNFDQQMFGFVARFSSNSQLVAQQICSCPSVSTNQRTAFLQPATKNICCGSSWSRQVKNAKHQPKPATKQCCATSWGFLYLVFRRL